MAKGRTRLSGDTGATVCFIFLEGRQFPWISETGPGPQLCGPSAAVWSVARGLRHCQALSKGPARGTAGPASSHTCSHAAVATGIGVLGTCRSPHRGRTHHRAALHGDRVSRTTTWVSQFPSETSPSWGPPDTPVASSEVGQCPGHRGGCFSLCVAFLAARAWGGQPRTHLPWKNMGDRRRGPGTPPRPLSHGSPANTGTSEANPLLTC